jgi:hypothetical protein
MGDSICDALTMLLKDLPFGKGLASRKAVIVYEMAQARRENPYHRSNLF